MMPDGRRHRSRPVREVWVLTATADGVATSGTGADEDQERLVAWVERTVGGRVTAVTRQPRWRPAYFLDVERDGERLPLYFRGRRGNDPTDLLVREGRLLNLLESHGVPVPHCYGFCEQPPGILLTGLPGHEVFQHASAQEQEQIAEEFLAALARWHAIPPEEVAALGFPMPAGPHEQHLMDLDALERTFRASVTPDTPPAPLLEFSLRWLRRNVPDHAGPTVLVQGDTGPGQFLFEGSRITGVVDWELAKLGDAMYDLACIRGRDLAYPFGDFPARLRRYSELSGIPLDMELLRYHSVRTMIITPIAIYPMFATGSLSAVDGVVYLAWDVVYSRAMVQCLAQAVGVALEDVAVPAGEDTPRSWLHDTLVRGLEREVLPAVSDPMNEYRVSSLAQLAGHLSLADRLGPQVDRAKLDDAETLLGFRPGSPREADAAVQELALAAGPERDADLIRYFWRDYRRQEALLGPVLGGLARTATLAPIED